MKRTVLVLAIAMGALTGRSGAQSGTVQDGIVLEASRVTDFGGRIELRERVIVTTEDFVLRADAADFFSGVSDRRIEARVGVSVSLNPKRVAARDHAVVMLREAQVRFTANHPDVRALLAEIGKLEVLQRKVEACTPGAFGLKVELPPARRVDPRESFLSQLNGAPEPLREFRCSAL